MNEQEGDITALWFEQEVVTSLEETLSSLQRAESSRRGFIITKNSVYLDSYNAATQEMKNSLGYLKQLNIHRVYQDAFLDSLEASANDKIMLSNSSIKISMGRNSSDSIQIVMTERGTEIMQSIRKTILQMLREKRNSRDDRYRTLGKTVIRMRSMLGDGMIVVTVVLSVLMLITYSSMRRITRNDETLRFDLYQARYQVQHATSRYQDLRIEVAEKLKKSGDEEHPVG